jgi:hypothetical protein
MQTRAIGRLQSPQSSHSFQHTAWDKNIATARARITGRITRIVRIHIVWMLVLLRSSGPLIGNSTLIFLLADRMLTDRVLSNSLRMRI